MSAEIVPISTSSKKKLRGFQLLSPKRMAEISSIGGKAAHAQGTGHEWNPAEAAEAGRKGGFATAANKRKALKVRTSLRSGGFDPNSSRNVLGVGCG